MSTERERAFDTLHRTDVVIRCSIACRAWEFAGGRLMLESMLRLREQIIERIKAMDEAAS